MAVIELIILHPHIPIMDIVLYTTRMIHKPRNNSYIHMWTARPRSAGASEQIEKGLICSSMNSKVSKLHLLFLLHHKNMSV